MLVSIDQRFCTGCSLCAEIAPDVFVLPDGDVAYVKDGDIVLSDPGGRDAKAPVPSALEAAVLEAARETPGECIYVEQA